MACLRSKRIVSRRNPDPNPVPNHQPEPSALTPLVSVRLWSSLFCVGMCSLQRRRQSAPLGGMGPCVHFTSQSLTRVPMSAPGPRVRRESTETARVTVLPSSNAQIMAPACSMDQSIVTLPRLCLHGKEAVSIPNTSGYWPLEYLAVTKRVEGTLGRRERSPRNGQSVPTRGYQPLFKHKPAFCANHSPDGNCSGFSSATLSGPPAHPDRAPSGHRLGSSSSRCTRPRRVSVPLHMAPDTMDSAPTLGLAGTGEGRGGGRGSVCGRHLKGTGGRRGRGQVPGHGHGPRTKKNAPKPPPHWGWTRQHGDTTTAVSGSPKRGAHTGRHETCCSLGCGWSC